MSELRELYQEVILDHSKRPRKRGTLEGECHRAEGHNPLCGDRVTVYLRVDGDRIAAIAFEGSGCAISTASASMMAEALEGRSLNEVEGMFETFHDLLTGGADPARMQDRLGKLIVFAGVREFPVRVKCATLAWHTMRAALQKTRETVTTE